MSEDLVFMRSIIMELVKAKFGSLAIWRIIEPEVAIYCSDLPEPTSEEKKVDFIEKVGVLKNYLIGQGIYEPELIFLDDEVERLKDTKTMSLYVEDDDSVDKQLIEDYARLGEGTEGVVGIKYPFNYKQLSKLTNGVYQKTGLIKFYISREKTIYGKIVAEIYEHSQKIPIAKLIESKIKSDRGDEVVKKILLFGDPKPEHKHRLLKEINIPFYVYRFISEKNEDMILMTTEKCVIGDYIITGSMTQCDDNKMLTDSARLTTKLPFFFAQIIRNRVIKYRNHSEFKQKLINLGITMESSFDFPFTIEKNGVTWNTLHPKWYKWLIWSWLVHQPKGLFNPYPMHLLIMGPKNSGKSLLINGLHARSKENKDIFSGSSSRMKSLIPSFKNNPAKLGYLAESNRFAFCDEFLRCLTAGGHSDGNGKEEAVALMNDLLEWQKREAGSGVSRVKVNMTSRVIATTNPIWGKTNVQDILETFDGSFMSRWMVYYQTPDHVDIIRKSKDSDLKQYHFKISVNDWISIIDYFHTFSAEYDMDRVEKIKDSFIPLLSETLADHYDARHTHHIECLMDGIVKARCMMYQNTSFKARDEDYEILEMVWTNIIRSWIDVKNVKKMPIKKRIHFLPENCQNVFEILAAEKKPLEREELKEIIGDKLSGSEYVDVFSILSDNGLIVFRDGKIKPYYMETEDEDEQQGL